MTSKEKVEKCISLLINKDKICPLDDSEKARLELFEKLLKDLERLALLEKAVDILKPYCYIEWDEVNDAFYFNVDASERIPLSEDYEINRCIIGLDDSDIDILKEVF